MTPNIERRLHADRQRVGMLVHQACVEEWLPDAKLEIIASQLRAEPLGLCVLVPGMEYQIVHYEMRPYYSKSTSVHTQMENIILNLKIMSLWGLREMCLHMFYQKSTPECCRNLTLIELIQCN